MKIDKNEVENTYLIPLDYFKQIEPEIYNLRTEVKPYHIDEDGNKEVYFPVDELGLPEAYQKPWGNKNIKYMFISTRKSYLGFDSGYFK